MPEADTISAGEWLKEAVSVKKWLRKNLKELEDNLHERKDPVGVAIIKRDEAVLTRMLIDRVRDDVKLTHLQLAALKQDLGTYAMFAEFERAGLVNTVRRIAVWINSFA